MLKVWEMTKSPFVTIHQVEKDKYRYGMCSLYKWIEHSMMGDCGDLPVWLADLSSFCFGAAGNRQGTTEENPELFSSPVIRSYNV